MQIISEPATRTIELRDIDLAIESAPVMSVTLRPEDSYEEDEREIRIGKGNERIRIMRDKVLWISERTRTITEKVKEAA
jgi:hypothetical protein